jgi:selenide,water dikinase
MTPSGPLLLAGGGHSHALLLKRWAMTPQLRPKRGVVLVNRHPTALYSGMVPGLIAGIYRRGRAEYQSSAPLRSSGGGLCAGRNQWY